jgi:hypothetical protein
MATTRSPQIRLRRAGWKRIVRLPQPGNPLKRRDQSAIRESAPATDPHGAPSDVESMGSIEFWDRCQPGTSNSLPLHRNYLFHFERIVAEAIAALNGLQDWTLPDCKCRDSANPDGLNLPPEFASPTLAGGSFNALCVAERNPVKVEDGSFGVVASTELGPDE